jgi:uncharacterized protein
MTDTTEPAAVSPGAPSDFLMALYMGDRDKAKSLAANLTLTLPELAAFGDLVSVGEFLTTHPESLQQYSPDGWTALHLAAFFGYSSVVVRLLRAGASISASSHNQQGNTALHAALAGRCEMPVVTALLAAGSNADAVDAQSYRPLHLAASRGDQAASELLIACGAVTSARTVDGKNAADIAHERGHPDLSDWLARH